MKYLSASARRRRAFFWAMTVSRRLSGTAFGSMARAFSRAALNPA